MRGHSSLLFQRFRIWLAVLLAAVAVSGQAETGATNSLVWRVKQNRVDARIESWTLQTLLEKVTTATGWKIFREPGLETRVSATFSNLPPDEALRFLLGDLNYARVRETNGLTRLLIFQKAQRNATQLVGLPAVNTNRSRLTNELVVTLKTGTNIDGLARQLGGRVLGRADDLHAYRLSFDNEAAANAARVEVAGNSDVASTDSNFSVARPVDAELLSSSAASPFALKPGAVADGGIVVGLIDTPIQGVGGAMQQFMLPSLSVVDSGTAAAGGGPTHGTSMAETILRGLALMDSATEGSRVRVLPVDVYGNSESTTTFDVARGIQAAVNAGANPINLSLGSDGDSSLLHSIVTRAHDLGVVFFAAAGNEGVSTPTFPAAYPEVIAVTATDARGNLASYANFGNFVDIAAPGKTIVYYNGRSYLVSGTSASTAYATGTAAGLADHSGKTVKQVEPAILSALAVKAVHP